LPRPLRNRALLCTFARLEEAVAEQVIERRHPDAWLFCRSSPCYGAGVPQLVRIASVAELPPEGELREFLLGQEAVCIANSGGVFTALGNACPHRGAPLSAGCIADGKLICYWHGWEFDLGNGGACEHPGRPAAKRFELVIEGDDVYVKA
jgi:nitrite reductase/ring-hydroxylating ferredoxin subunit